MFPLAYPLSVDDSILFPLFLTDPSIDNNLTFSNLPLCFILTFFLIRSLASMYRIYNRFFIKQTGFAGLDFFWMVIAGDDFVRLGNIGC